MKKIFLCILLSYNLICHAQTKSPANYILVRFDLAYDNPNDRSYFIINPERGGTGLPKEIYSLIKYDNKKKAINTGGVFYPAQNDTSALYNYFYSTTEALNYLSKNGWELLTIYTEISSGHDDRSTGTITTISSRLIFCFKK